MLTPRSMGQPSEQSRKKLRLVEPRHELSGKFPRGFERAARSCAAGDALHRALLFGALTLTRRALSQCLPPSVAAVAKDHAAGVEAWAQHSATLKQVQQRRAQLFEQVPELEARTLQAVRRSRPEATAKAPGTSLAHGSAPHNVGSADGAATSRTTASPFDEHADNVVERYVALSVHHALAALLLCCDAVTEPALVLDVPGEVAGALAYRNVGLGPARQSELRTSALQHAQWEASRIATCASHGEAALTLQLFHEYLGVHWKNHVDAQRLYLEQFLAWVFDELPLH
jgi:hypothetical protein